MDGSRLPAALAGHRRLAVLGSPIAHSKSPAIHAAAYRELGLDWSYDRCRVEAADLAEFLRAHDDGWRGFSLTMPLKEEARRIARVVDPVAEESGVVNTLLRLSGDTGWAGFNTDVGGLAAAVERAGLDAARTAVIGSGATAVSAVLAARRLGARHVEIVARNARAVAELVARFDGTREAGARGADVRGADVREADATAPLRVSGTNLRFPEAVGTPVEPTLIISTLPGPASAQLSLPDALTRIPLFDVVYDPWPSPLAERWRAAGGEAHSGVGMLVEQALLQVRVFLCGDPALPVPDEDGVLAAMRGAAGEAPGMGG